MTSDRVTVTCLLFSDIHVFRKSSAGGFKPSFKTVRSCANQKSSRTQDCPLEPRLSANANEIHSLTYDLMMNYKRAYYESKVDAFLSRMSLVDIPKELKLKLRKEMLKSLEADGVEYANFMEEASRRVSQTFQVISGNP